MTYYVGFVVLGLSTAAIGPSLDYLAAHTGSLLSAVSAAFVANASGRMVSSYLGGRLYDRLRGHPVMAAALVVAALMHTLIPTLGTLWLLLVIVFVLGLAEGTFDVGANTLLIMVHGKKVGPYMQALHFMFGLGALLMPPVVARSIKLSGDVNWAFWVVALCMLPLALWYARLPSPVHTRTRVTAPQDPSTQTAQPNTASSGNGLLLLFAVWFFVFVGFEALYGGWAFKYGRAFGLNETNAAWLTSIFFFGFTLGRLISIPLAARLRARVMLWLDVVGMVIGAALLLASHESAVALWGGMFLAGLAVASLFATGLAFAEERMAVTGRIAGILLTAANMGAMFFPWLVGQFFDSAGPHTVTWTGIGTAVATVALLAVLVYLMQAKDSVSSAQQTALRDTES
jgi:FHS family Na+ dependent glucose MFS transporter 1